MDGLGPEQEEIASYGLGPESVVVVVGAYEGKTVLALSDLYDCTIHAFEPMPHARYKFAERVGPREKVHLYPYAVGMHEGWLPMEEYGTFGGSFVGNALGEFEKRRQLGHGRMVKWVDGVIKAAGVLQIDLLHMNIEGYEFYLLPYLIETGLIANVRYLMVQFHTKCREAARYDLIRETLSKTHHIRWDIGVTWSSWKRTRG